jgi:hypothetical protein
VHFHQHAAYGFEPECRTDVDNSRDEEHLPGARRQMHEEANVHEPDDDHADGRGMIQAKNKQACRSNRLWSIAMTHLVQRSGFVDRQADENGRQTGPMPAKTRPLLPSRMGNHAQEQRRQEKRSGSEPARDVVLDIEVEPPRQLADAAVIGGGAQNGDARRHTGSHDNADQPEEDLRESLRAAPDNELRRDGPVAVRTRHDVRLVVNQLPPCPRGLSSMTGVGFASTARPQSTDGTRHEVQL